MKENVCVEIDTIEMLSTNIHLVDNLLWSNVLSKSDEILLTSARDITFTLKGKVKYDKSFPIPNYDINDERYQILLKRNNLTTAKKFYLYDNDNGDSLSLFLVNEGYQVNILTNVTSFNIVKMTAKEIDRFCKNSSSYYKYWLEKLSQMYQFQNYPERLEKDLVLLFKNLDWNKIDNQQMDEFLSGHIFKLEDSYYNLLVYQLIKNSIIMSLQFRI